MIIKGVTGWIVSLWIDAMQEKANERDSLPYLSWSPYDRMTIVKAEEFSHFFEPEDSVEWNGTVQRLHLIPMQKSFNWEPGDACLIRTPDGEENCYGLYCIVTARLANRVANIQDVEERICQKLSKVLQDKKICWQGFHSLGAEDFVGIFLADTIKDLSEAVEALRQMSIARAGKKKELFGSINSLCGKNNPKFSGEPGADLIVRLNLKSGQCKSEVRAKLDEELRKRFESVYNRITIKELVIGKGCFQVEVPNHPSILSCFDDDGIFNGVSPFYEGYIASSRTYWSVAMGIDTTPEDVNIGAVEFKEDSKEIDGISLPEGSKSLPVSRFILKEYERMLNANNCLWWKPILKRQYEVYADFVVEYTKQGDYEALCSLSNKIQTVLLHINQATAPIYEIPYHNYYYSGSYNDILRMYYGIITAIFNLGCGLTREENTKQYKIVFCVDFEAATKVHSTMYKLKEGGVETARFVIFHLPYDAFMEVGKTIRFLFHEVFHYIAPYDRKKRNTTFVKAWTVEVFGQYKRILTKYKMPARYWEAAAKYFYEHFNEFFEKINNTISMPLQDMILNDFTEKDKIQKRENTLYIICRIIYEELQNNIGYIMKKVDASCTYDTIYREMFSSDIMKNSFYESIYKLALAAKEAFCDLNMLYALDMSLEQYLLLIQDTLFRQYKDESKVIDAKLSDLLKNEQFSMGSFELRIGMVFDRYLDNLPGDDTSGEYKRDTLKRELDKIDYDALGLSRNLSQYLFKMYNFYTSNHVKKRTIFAEFFELENKWFESYSENEDIPKLRRAAASHKEISENLSVIHDFMGVEIKDDLLNVNWKPSEAAAHYALDDRWFRDVTTVKSLGEYVSKVCELVDKWKGGDYWYRGLCSKDHKLLPSLTRYLDEGSSLYVNQTRFLKDAYYTTLSDPTLWNEQTKGIAEHTCLLQHYGMPTSLLDFSNDMLVALHFALNPDVLEDRRKVDEYVHQPKVVLFNPLIYNEAILSLQKEKLVRNLGNISPVLFDVYDDTVSEYFVQDMSSEYLLKISRDIEGYVSNPRVNKYPRPIVIRRGNARILAQSGTFLAYNLYAKPDKSLKEPYDYLALENIQKDYQKLLRDNGQQEEDGKFIEEIYIHQYAVPSIKKELQTMKITTARMYPELHRSFEEYMKKLKEKK